MKSYTITEIEDAFDEFMDDPEASPTLERAYIEVAVDDFVTWLRRREEIDELLMAEDEEEGQPVDLFGAGGVPGLATKEEIDDLMLVRDGIEGCCGGLDDKCCG